MRINQKLMITKRKISDLLSISPNSFCKEMYRDQFGEFLFISQGMLSAMQVNDTNRVR